MKKDPSLLECIETLHSMKIQQINQRADLRQLSNYIVMAKSSLDQGDHIFADTMIGRARDLIIKMI